MQPALAASAIAPCHCACCVVSCCCGMLALRLRWLQETLGGVAGAPCLLTSLLVPQPEARASRCRTSTSLRQLAEQVYPDSRRLCPSHLAAAICHRERETEPWDAAARLS